MPIDHVLKLYSETIRSPYLHYGFWDEPSSLIVDDITLDEIVKAQERYIDHLSSFIPDEVKNILDVGAGIGGNSDFLIKKGYTVDALSPDEYQQKIFQEKYKGNVHFYKTKFEDFVPPKQYDLILESESACYIKIEEGWKVAKEAIVDGGYLLASDYFYFFNDGSSDWHIKAAHNEEKYLETAKKYGFTLIKEFDQTDNTMPTLDGAKVFVDRFLHPTIEFSSNYFILNYPFISKFFSKIFGKKIDSKLEQLSLLNSKDFKKYKRYMIYLFKKETT